MVNSNALSFRFQGTTLIITTFSIMLFVGVQLLKFCTLDQPPPIVPITPKTVAQFAGKPTPVTVGMTITDFPEFKVTLNSFAITGIIWFRFDPSLISLSTIEKFSFVKGKIDYISPPITLLDGDMLIARYQFRATFRTNLYYGFFPFEDHTLYLMLTNMAVNPDEMLFDSSYANLIVDKPFISGWDYADHRVSAGYHLVPLGGPLQEKEIAHPAVLFGLDFFHHSIRYIITILLPLLIIFFINMFSFCFDQEKEHSTLVGLTTANIAALVTYRFIIEHITPKIGYPTIADYFYFLFLTVTFITFLVNSVGPYLTIVQKKVLSLAIQATVLVVILYLLLIWIPC